MKLLSTIARLRPMLVYGVIKVGGRISEAPIYPGSQVSIDHSTKTPRIPIVDQ